MFSEGLLAVRSKLKGGKMRYVPMSPELASELKRYPSVIGEDRIFPPDSDAVSGRQCVRKSFEDLLERAGIDFRFQDLRHTHSHLGT
jgi:integrase